MWALFGIGAIVFALINIAGHIEKTSKVVWIYKYVFNYFYYVLILFRWSKKSCCRRLVWFNGFTFPLRKNITGVLMSKN